QPVAAWLLVCLDRAPTPIGGPVQPFVVSDAAAVEDRGQLERQERARLRRPPRRVRVVLEAGEYEWDAAIVICDRDEPGAGLAAHLAVRGSGLVQDVEGVQRRRRLAAWATQIGLERMAEAPVGVAVAAQRIEHRLGRTVGEQQRVAVPVEQTCSAPDEALGGTLIDCHAL